MKLTFYGAAKTVTGSCHHLECGNVRVLVDCGLRQGADEEENGFFPFHPGNIDAVILTHAHIDHSGRLPLLVKLGFKGPIYATGATCKLADIMLRDSAHIQESDAEWKNRKGKRSGKADALPLYTMADAEKTLEQLVPCSYGETVRVSEEITLRFTDAGHMLGSAFGELCATEDGETKKLVFSGDIGNLNQPIIRDPSLVTEADFVVMESTYGNRRHEKQGNYKASLAQIVEDTFTAGGNLIIPAFAVGRTQELLYYFREIKEEGLVKRFPDFPVYVDSPLAREATMIFAGDQTGYLDEDALQLVQSNVGLFAFPNLYLCRTTEESKRLNEDTTSKVIISASGMCDAGRIRHHLKHNLWRKESTILFVGFQARGGLGRLLLDGVDAVKLFGEEIAVNARIQEMYGLSAHADQAGLLEWIGGFSPPPRHVFVVHGDSDVAPFFAGLLKERGLSAHAPDYKEAYDLIADTVLVPGTPPVKRRRELRESPAYRRLVAAGEQLMEVISRNRGGANRDLGRFADQIRALIDKWDR